MSVYNFTVQSCASFGNQIQNIFDFRVLEVRDMILSPFRSWSIRKSAYVNTFFQY